MTNSEAKHELTLDDILVMTASNDKRVNEIADKVLKKRQEILMEKLCNRGERWLIKGKL